MDYRVLAFPLVLLIMSLSGCDNRHEAGVKKKDAVKIRQKEL